MDHLSGFHPIRRMQMLENRRYSIIIVRKVTGQKKCVFYAVARFIKHSRNSLELPLGTTKMRDLSEYQLNHTFPDHY